MPRKQRRRGYLEAFNDVLKILSNNHPDPCSNYHIMRNTNLAYEQIAKYMKSADEMGLVEISSMKRKSREIPVYSITNLGLKASSEWDIYKTVLRRLGIKDLIVTEVE